jgi:hypothetical protein
MRFRRIARDVDRNLITACLAVWNEVGAVLQRT